MAKRCEHDWQPLFERPTTGDDSGLRFDWSVYLARTCAGDRFCAACGAVAFVSGGRRRGGGRHVRLYRDEDNIAERKRKAEEWNGRLRASRETAAA